MSTPTSQDLEAVFSWHNAWYLAYGTVMFAILSIGFLGNALTVIILRRHEHASKSLTPLMINLSIGSLIIIVLGYPVVISLLLRGGQISKEDATCRWNALINGIVGMFVVLSVNYQRSVSDVVPLRCCIKYLTLTHI